MNPALLIIAFIVDVAVGIWAFMAVDGAFLSIAAGIGAFSITGMLTGLLLGAIGDK